MTGVKRWSSLARIAPAVLVVGALATRPTWAQDDLVERVPDVVTAADSVAAPVADFPAFLGAFLLQRPDSTQVAHVSHLALARDAGRFELGEGDLWLGTPVVGRVCAAVFVGTGTF